MHILVAGTTFVFRRGMEAIRSLIKGAREVETNKPYKLYEKPGGFAQAAADFKALKPYLHMSYGVCLLIYIVQTEENLYYQILHDIYVNW